ncbi:MAG: DUF2878 domain-containing protein [Planctomycetes bacterium]|nr:DUF2878 domain-containing protein [Planctomycetota bacterium]
MRFLFVVVGYKVVWLTSVLGREGWWGGVASLVYLLFLSFHPLRLRRRWLLAAPIGFAFGSIVDGMLASVGAIEFRHLPVIRGLPIWMPMLWSSFAAAIPILLQRLRSRPLLVALFGALGGPGAYFGALRLGAIDSVAPWAWWIVALEWALFPVAILFLVYPKVDLALKR